VPRVLPPWAARHLARTSNRLAETIDTVQQIQKEAKKAGATLKNNGKGGLDPKLALAVFQRDKWTCQNTNCPTPKQDLSLDHIAGHAKELRNANAQRDPALRQGMELGHVDKVAALHVLCGPCHDGVHARERAIQDGKRPENIRGLGRASQPKADK
jgi:5-methylcytosine-specific restriction endonuclease McrA